MGGERRRLRHQRVHRSQRPRRVRRGVVPHRDPAAHDPFVRRRHAVRPVGDWFPWLSLVIVAGMVLVPRTRTGVRGAPAPLSSDHRRTLVVLPTYEERDTIEWVLARLLDLPERVDVLVVDDSSPDGTGRARAGRIGGRASGTAARAFAEVRARERVPGWVPRRCWPTGTTCSSRWTPISPTSPKSSPASSRRPYQAAT